jgi:NAD(P)-dependent dehydrogenase (short-subunit alcohol dehydrogenase family)
MTQLPAVLVTGGSRGIGAAICRLLAANGYPVAVNYTTRPDAADAVVSAIKAAGGQAVAVGGDVADPAAVSAMFTQAEAALGPIGGLVNNAGMVGTAARVDQQTAADMERLFAVNVFGTIYCAQEAVRRMSKTHGGAGGTIVNISSVAARLGGLPGGAIYAMTKGAVESFSKGLSNEVAGEGIRVNVLAPGMTATDMTTMEMREQAQKSGIPMARVGEAEEIAQGVLWLISPASSYVTGTVVTVSGGR